MKKINKKKVLIIVVAILFVISGMAIILNKKEVTKMSTDIDNNVNMAKTNIIQLPQHINIKVSFFHNTYDQVPTELPYSEGVYSDCGQIEDAIIKAARDQISYIISGNKLDGADIEIESGSCAFDGQVFFENNYVLKANLYKYYPVYKSTVNPLSGRSDVQNVGTVKIYNGPSIGENPNIVSIANSMNTTDYMFKGYSFDRSHVQEEVANLSTRELAGTNALYVIAEPKRIPLYFNGNGGRINGELIHEGYVFSNIEYGNAGTDDMTLFESAEKEGYSFDGWWSTSTGGTRYDDSLKTRTALTLYARYYPNTYRVTFDGNGGTNPSYTTVTFDDTYGTLPTSSRKGYTFTGWYTQAQGGIKVTVYSTVTTPSDHTLYAHWTPNKYKVYFDSNDGEDYRVEGTATYDQKLGNIVPNFDEIRDGYEFLGFYTDPQNGTQVTSGTVYQVDGQTVYYAHWKPRQYRVSFDGNGGTSPDPIMVTFDSTYGNLPTPTRSGAKFDGWYTSRTGGYKVTNSTTVLYNDEHTLFAHWSVANCSIVFDANDGTGYKETVGVVYNEPIGSALPNFSNRRPGYTLTGFFTSAVGGSEVTANTIVSTAGTVTYYAQWTKAAIQVQFDANGGITPFAEKGVFYKDAYGSMPEPYKNGYKFLGWYTQRSGGTKVTADTINNNPNEHTLYAHWNNEVVNNTNNTIEYENGGEEKKVSDYKNESGGVTEVKDKDNNTKSDDKPLATGDIVVKDGKEYRVVIKGDISGDGKVTTIDYVKLWNHLDRKNPFTLTKDYEISAADINSDSQLKTQDYILLWNLLKRK